MAKQLIIPYEDKEYTLEYTRKTITEMERKGFVASDVENKPMTVLPALFAGAFLAHHRYVNTELIDEIFSKLTKKDELIGKLVEMYNEPIMALISEPEDKKGNIAWTATW